MTNIAQIFRRGKRSSYQREHPPNLGSQQPSSSTVESNTSSGLNSHVSLSSRGFPEPEPLRRVPENAADYRSPAELYAPGNTSWVSVPRTPQPPRYYQQHEQQQHEQQQHLQQPRQQPQPQRIIIANEETISRARQANDITTQRNEERRILERRRNASADNVRRLRALIRERYALDLYVWEKRNVPKASRKRIEPSCKKADAILQEIYFIVNDWDEDLFDDQEWQIVKRIKAGLSTRPMEDGESGEPAIWGDLAPWDRRDDAEQRSRAIESC